MSRQLRVFHGWIMSPPWWDVRHSDGRRQAQATVAVRATSVAEAARVLTEATGTTISVHHVRNYMAASGNPATLAALDAHPPLTVLAAPLHPGNTIAGQDGWVIPPEVPKDRRRP